MKWALLTLTPFSISADIYLEPPTSCLLGIRAGICLRPTCLPLPPCLSPSTQTEALQKPPEAPKMLDSFPKAQLSWRRWCDPDLVSLLRSQDLICRFWVCSAGPFSLPASPLPPPSYIYWYCSCFHSGKISFAPLEFRFKETCFCLSAKSFQMSYFGIESIEISKKLARQTLKTTLWE